MSKSEVKNIGGSEFHSDSATAHSRAHVQYFEEQSGLKRAAKSSVGLWRVFGQVAAPYDSPGPAPRFTQRTSQPHFWQSRNGIFGRLPPTRSLPGRLERRQETIR